LFVNVLSLARLFVVDMMKFDKEQLANDNLIAYSTITFASLIFLSAGPSSTAIHSALASLTNRIENSMNNSCCLVLIERKKML
jgi:hypothetical protein